MHARNMNACASGCRHRMNNWHLPRGKLTSVSHHPGLDYACGMHAYMQSRMHAQAMHRTFQIRMFCVHGSHNLRKPATGTAGQVFGHVSADVIQPPVWSATLSDYRVQDLSLIYHYPPSSAARPQVQTRKYWPHKITISKQRLGECF